MTYEEFVEKMQKHEAELAPLSAEMKEVVLWARREHLGHFWRYISGPAPTDMRVDELEISIRTVRALRGAGIEYVHQLVLKTRDEIGKIPQVGPKSLRVIEHALKSEGLNLFLAPRKP